MFHSAILSLILESAITPYLIILTSVFYIGRYMLVRQLDPKCRLRLPGPRGLPYVGSIPFLGSENKLHLTFTKLAKKYGPIYRLSLGSSEAVIISDPNLIKEAFRMDQFSARPDMLFVKEIVSGNGIILSEGDMWKEQRRFALQQMRHLGMYRLASEEDQLSQKIQSEIRYFTDTLEERSGQPIGLDYLLGGVMGNIICTIICGKRFAYDDPTFLGCLSTMEEGFRLVKLSMGINFMPFLRIIPMMNTVYLKIKDNNIATKAFFRSLIKERADTIEVGKTRDFVDAYLHQIQRLQDAEKFETSNFTDAQMMQCVIDLFSAGMETTRTSLEWAFLYMALHPEVQSQVQEELDRVVGIERVPSMDDLKELPFTEATICEVLRASSVVPLGNPHAASEDTMFHGHLVPKGATIFSNLWAVHNDETLWHNPSEFNPSRFLVDGKVERPPHFMPFSTGRRVCLGDHLAKAEIYLVFASVLQRFQVSIPAGESKPDCQGLFGMTLKPKAHRLSMTLRHKPKSVQPATFTEPARPA
ncbi:Cytochrome P450 18a1 [Hypsibius exemplaris]|uniref:Cytochrome P450 18a1 n=1 Tax=Hypsibius exemplaris TaxID=2072580 RepID=A0A1W0WMT0_HYPEX|nr:Cytochrome P450 18a1 [Hypsibius exemplaris]